jgi:hypothetical protein
MKGKILAAVAAAVLLSASLYAGVGTTGAQFLKIGPSARALAMGGAFGAVSDDVYGLYFNPSGIANAERTEISATYISYFADISYAYAGFVKPDTKMGAIGLAITNVGVSNIERRTADTAEAIDKFGATDMAITLAWAKKDAVPQMIKDTSLGASLKVISSKLDTKSASAFAIDLAATHKVSEKVTTALVIQNISGGIKFDQVSDPLPLNLKLAGALKLNEKALVALDLDQGISDSKLYASLGAEYWVVKQLALRVGYKYGYATSNLGTTVGLGVGIGFRMWECGLDYAFVPFGDLGDTHRVSLSYRFGK